MIWIRGIGDYCEAVGEQPPPLKGVVQEALGTPVRRIGRFIQLALIGTGRCMAGRAPDPASAVYMSSARGDLETTLEVVETLFRQGMPPMPLSFVNTVSNAPCYYVARHFGLAGRSSFVCSRCFAYESALGLAVFDMESGYMDSALIGSVDVATQPVADHRRRLQLPRDAEIAEGSHWAWLEAAPEPPADAVGEVVAAREFGDRDALVAWFREQEALTGDWRIAAGQFLDREDFDAIRRATGIGQTFRPPASPGYYDSRTGAQIHAFLRGRHGSGLLHVNGEIDGPRCTATVVRRR